ncbi:hypothetical protein [Desulfogranum marinum]|uniref:hypothetical protein n=1 Tax=Desulfogranum marinum TaxID=453220 RepID=UPI0029C7D86E|nr:hypothetical protein [Desulfogranum marinum]
MKGREWENKGQNDTNAQIITTDSGRIYKPKNLLNAISEVQQFYVIESKGQNIPAEFLTLERTIDFFKIGLKSGFHEGFTLVLLFPVFHFYLFPFVFRQLDLFSRIAFGCIPYIVLLVNTAMCCYISRYYVGNITRKAINSLLVGRAMSLLLKAFILYVVYLVLYRLSTPENIWKIAMQFEAKAERIYDGFFEIKPHLLPVATKSAILMVMAAIFPYGSVYFLDLWHRYRIKKNKKTISA